VAMSVMSIVMGIFTTGILQLYRSANKNTALAQTSSQTNLVFLRLDRELRYAAGFSTPASIGGNPYVEYVTLGSGSATCAELRLNVTSGQLQRRTWTQGSSPVTPTTWLPLAANLSGATPFTVSAADATYPFQRLRLQLTAAAGTGRDASTGGLDVTFSALNTSLSTASTTVCTEGRAIP
jgi:hypothetical protein